MPNHIQNNLAFDCQPDRLREILFRIQAEDNGENEVFGIGTIDFGKLIPMPESLHIESGSRATNGMSLYLTSLNPNVKHFGAPEDKLPEEELLPLYYQIKQSRGTFGINPSLTEGEIQDMTKYNSEAELLNLGKQAVQNVLDYGAPTWYDWSVIHWGTKWNSYSNSYNEETGILGFQTAWSAPHPILLKLSEMFPDVTIKHEWADEDMGSNCGMRVYLGGEVIQEYFPEGKEAMEWAADTWGCDLGDCGLLLNASETDYIYVEEDEYDLVEFDGQPVLFSNGRITRKDIPKGLFCYDIRQSDDQSEFCAIERYVRVNHGGSIITNQPLDFAGNDHIPLTYDHGLNFLGDQITLGEYMSGDFNQEEEYGEMSLS